MKKALSVILAALMLSSAFILSVPAAENAPKDGQVLYEEDFENGLPDDIRVIRGGEEKVTVEDGFLVLNAVGQEFVSVLLPEYLAEYDSCEITANVCMTEERDSARWCSIMFRVQNSDYPYYHMCVRKNSTLENGVEFAKRNNSNKWEVTHKSGAKAGLSATETTELKLRFYGSTVEEYLNGELVVTADSADGLTKGEMGLTANFCVLKVDSVKVTYIDESSIVSSPLAGSVELTNDTGVIGGFTLSEFAESKTDIENILKAEKKPQNVIMYVNEELQATAENGMVAYGDAIDCAEALNGEIMPTFYVYTVEAAEKLASALKSARINDCFIMSADGNAVTAARKAHPLCRGVLDMREALKGKTELTDKELIAIRDKTNLAGASIVMLPAECATDANVEYIIDRLVSVWVYGRISSVTDAYSIAAAGGHGAVTDNTAVMYDVFSSYMTGNKLLRTPLVVGHRGTVKYAPENTVEGSLLAYKNGADAIETDIYLTKDGEIVCIHDATTARTCGTNLNVEECTLAELKALTANNEWKSNKKYNEVKIPTLEEYFEHFKGEDVQLFIEIKSTKPAIIDKLVEQIVAHNIADQVSIITFHSNQLQRMKAAYPEISCGFLCSPLVSGSDGSSGAMNVLQTVQKLYSTYNPSYSGHSKAFIENANMRGTNVYPWTINDSNVFASYFAEGYNGLTTDDSKLAFDYAKNLSSSAYAFEVPVGGSHAVTASLETYGRKTSDVSADVRVILLDGADGVTVSEGNVLTFAKEGTYTYALEYEYDVNGKSTYTIHTMPVTVTVAAPAADTQGEATLPEASGTDGQTTDGSSAPAQNNNTLIIILAVIGAVAIAAVIVVIVAKKNKK